MITKRLRIGNPISKMLVVRHRVNTLERINPELGIEFDVRESSLGIAVTHDPWTPGPSLNEFLEAQKGRPFYIVNIKCEGIECRVLDCLSRHGITNFFLLDCSFPSIVKLSSNGETRLAIRRSEYEEIPTSLYGKVRWVWIDCFSKIPVSHEECQMLRANGFKLCFVSPELHGRPNDLLDYGIQMAGCVDMVCTKFPTAWSDFSEIFRLANGEPRQPGFL